MFSLGCYLEHTELLLLMLTFLFLGGLCLLGAYADSDDEESDASEKPAQSKESNGNQSTDIDSTLANFLAVSGVLFGFFKLLKPLWDSELNWLAYLAISVSLSLHLPLSLSSLVPSVSFPFLFVKVVRRRKVENRRVWGTCVSGR